MPIATSATFGCSPMPNQMMTSGRSPSTGTERNTCTDESTMSSPHRNRPAITASTTPTVTPMASPRNARCSDAARWVCSSPVWSQLPSRLEHLRRSGEGPLVDHAGRAQQLPAHEQQHRTGETTQPAGHAVAACPRAAGHASWRSAWSAAWGAAGSPVAAARGAGAATRSLGTTFGVRRFGVTVDITSLRASRRVRRRGRHGRGRLRSAPTRARRGRSAPRR